MLHAKGDFGDLLGGPVDIHLDGVTMELGGLVMLDVSIPCRFDFLPHAVTVQLPSLVKL